MRPCDARESGLDVLLGLAAQADRREGLGERHSRAVAAVARLIALELGLGLRGAALAYLAGLLHDVGKLTVPEAVLRKPARLGADEWTLLRAQPLEGAALVRMHGDPLLAPVVAACHERWDGSGYPEGLAAGEAPAAARVLAVANALVSMTEPRAFRRAASDAAALAEVRRGGGRRYDPAVVAAVAELARERRLRLEPAPAEPLGLAV